MKKISVLVVEDNRLLREGICAMLKTQADMHVVATVGNGENIVSLIEKGKPDVILLDLGLRSQNSLDVVKLITRQHLTVKIIVMDLIPMQKDVYEFVQAGVVGFILKDAKISDFYSTIRSVYEGANVLPQNLTDSLFAQIVAFGIKEVKPSIIKDSIRMTSRERQVVELIAQGCANKEIAEKLHLSTFTIKSHVHNILEKLSLHSRVQVANYAHDSDSSNPNLL